MLFLVGLVCKFVCVIGIETCDFRAFVCPELNSAVRAGAYASSSGMVYAGFENKKEINKMKMENKKEIEEMKNENKKEIDGIK